MAAAAIGLEISSLCVRMAEVHTTKTGPVLDALLEEPLPPGAVISGEVRDPEAVTAALRSLWSKNRIKGKRVVLGVAGQRVAVRHAQIPWLPESDLIQALPLHAGDVLPFDANEAALDYVINSEFTDPEGNRKYQGILVAAALDFIVPLVEAVQAAKLTVVGVDLTAFAVLRASCQPSHWQQQPPEALVNVCSQMTQVVVHTGGRPELVRGLVVGSERVVEQFGLLDPTSPTATVDALEPLVEEIVTTLEYYQASNPGRPLSRLLLTGEGSLLPGIEYALSSTLQLPVLRDTAWLALPRAQLAVTEEHLRVLAPNMSGVVGLALGAAA